MSSPSDKHLHAEIHSPSRLNAASILASLSLATVPEPDEIHREIEEALLLPKERLPEHWLSTYQIGWSEDLHIPSLLPIAPAPAPTRVELVRTGLEGHLTGYTEVRTPKLATGLTSTSLTRPPTSARAFVRGKSGNSPFFPGGLEDVVGAGGLENNGRVRSFQSQGGSPKLRSVAPGLPRGLRIPGGSLETDGDGTDINFGANMGMGMGIYEGGHSALEVCSELNQAFTPPSYSDVDDLLPLSRKYLMSSNTSLPRAQQLRQRQLQKRDWAHVVDITKPMPEYELLKAGGGLAKEYPFPLDPFQKAAITHLEQNESVFVAAHTSAGKTVVAEYAIALAGRHVTRAIYTSPIKALSNQKFRDFKTTFGASSVGILTGDVQINPEAPCLIMTTEILRSMLYKGADLIRDVEWVVFDEVHYVSDAERGVVWEEVIIMLPEHVNVILLSATIPNTREFADWVGRTKKKDIYVISTPKRPVPLEHYLYAGREIHKIVDAKGEFLSLGYKDAGEALRRKQDKEREAAGLPPVVRVGARGAPPALRGGAQRGSPKAQRGSAPGRTVPRGGGGGGTRFSHPHQDKSLYVHLLGHLRKQNLLPTVVFTFSKKRCEEQAGTLTNVDLCTSVEKSEVHVALEKALGRLSGSDKKLPQIGKMHELLSRGIGVHHGGLLPIVKEVVEILFARGLVKILFATETFAVGVNMPARCVVFSGIHKHDGRSFREILPGEYTQMSGRAGRRGLDATGVVIIVVGDELPGTPVLHKMMLGTPSRLQSHFRLTYNMILNLLRVEALRVEEMLKRSFSENASQRLLPDQQKKVAESEKILHMLPKLECDRCYPSIEGFYDISAEILDRNQVILELAIGHQQGMKVLSSGRVVVLRDGHFPSNAGVLLKAAPFQTSAAGLLDHVKHYFVLALVTPETKSGANDTEVQAVPPRWPPTPESLLVDNGVYELVTVPFSSISLISNRTMKLRYHSSPPWTYCHHRIAQMRDAIAQLDRLVCEWVQERHAHVPEVDWGRMRQLEFQETLGKRDAAALRLPGHACLACPDFEEHYCTLHGEKMLRANIATLKLAISDQNLELLPDYEQRIDVLKDLKFIDENSTVLLKGRVACEINSAHELILTELILENTLATYEPEEVVALISCFVFQEKTDIEPVISSKLQTGRDAILAIVERVGAVQLKRGVGEDLDARIKFGLVEVVYEWAKGMPFEQITALTDVAEGTIVRVITRLDETCREIRDAARVIGDAEIFKKMEEAQIKIKRDIVFAASLYF
ncbi:antiviral helicase [Ramaria rubella]|nr:antiviral helicase [Ramaria rubella]